MKCCLGASTLAIACALASMLHAAGAAGQTGASAAVRIDVTEVPPADCGGPTKRALIRGNVAGPLAPHFRVVFYAAACNGVLYVQPTVAAPKTPIVGGTFSAFIHLGHTYYVLLVTDDFVPDATIDLARLPRVGGPVVAVARVAGRR